jgi:hypothetical protein
MSHRVTFPISMRLPILVVGIAMIAAANSAAPRDLPYELSNLGSPPPKSPVASPWHAPASPEAGGDNLATAVVIPSLPYTDSGNTCAFNNDYAFPCGDANSAPAPDVVYKFIPSATMCVDISVCNSDFDTGLYVWQTSVGNVIACNDDYCGPTVQQSRIAGLQLQAGVTYYIVVDAYAGCGNYSLSVTQAACRTACAPLACPTGAISENEPYCYTGYVDSYNGGCTSTPAVFQSISVPSIVCGRYGKYCSDDIFCFTTYRDTDWYRLVVTSPMTVRVCVQGEANTQLDVVDGTTGCPGTILPGSVGLPLACDTYCEEVSLVSGTYWIFVAPQQDASFPACGSRYVLQITTPTVRAKQGSWGTLKSIYR